MDCEDGCTCSLCIQDRAEAVLAILNAIHRQIGEGQSFFISKTFLDRERVRKSELLSLGYDVRLSRDGDAYILWLH